MIKYKKRFLYKDTSCSIMQRVDKEMDEWIGILYYQNYSLKKIAKRV